MVFFQKNDCVSKEFHIVNFLFDLMIEVQSVTLLDSQSTSIPQSFTLHSLLSKPILTKTSCLDAFPYNLTPQNPNDELHRLYPSNNPHRISIRKYACLNK